MPHANKIAASNVRLSQGMTRYSVVADFMGKPSLYLSIQARPC